LKKKSSNNKYKILTWISLGLKIQGIIIKQKKN